MAKDPAFLFYPGDWMGGTMHMQRITRACYFDLLMLQFNRGGFSYSEMTNCLGNDASNWDLIKDKFLNEKGIFYNDRLKIEIEKRRRFTESRKAGAYAMHKHMLMENENRNKIKDVKDITKENIIIGSDSWRDDFEIYLKQEIEAFNKYSTDQEWIAERQRFHPNLDIVLSLEKAHVDFWKKESGWKNKKKSKSKNLDWESTFRNALDLQCNKIYLPRERTNIKPPNSKYTPDGRLKVVI